MDASLIQVRSKCAAGAWMAVLTTSATCSTQVVLYELFIAHRPVSFLTLIGSFVTIES